MTLGTISIAAPPAGRRKAIGLMLACSAMVGPVICLPSPALSQTLFPTYDSTLPALPGGQVGTAGTTTITRNTPTTATPAYATSPSTDGFTTLPDYTDPNGAYDAQNGGYTGQNGSGTGIGTGQSGTGRDGRNPRDTVTTGQQATFDQRNRDVANDQDQDLNRTYDPDYEQTLDPGAEPIDQQEAPRPAGDPTGIRMGSFMLRPSINQSINTETIKDNDGTDRRDYFATGIRGTLTSDWSRHALTIDGEGTFEKNIKGGEKHLEPEGNLNADLRLDLSEGTTAHITAGYSFAREENDDPNAISDAKVQSGVSLYQGGASLERNLGIIHALGAINVGRYVYSDAELSDGSILEMGDRNRTGVDGRLRLGYELSAAIVPFVEVASGHTFYDRKRDTYGYQRSSQSYALRTGIEFDLGEKLRGEIGTGYQLVNYDDSRLSSIDGVTFDGKAIWSPQRGTDINIGLRSQVQDSTTPGESGWVEYQLTSALAHQLRNNVVARMSAGATIRDFSNNVEDNFTWVAGTGLTWNINRYLDLTADLEYQRTTGGTDDESEFRAGIGLTLRR